jgi:hypothetical protein
MSIVLPPATHHAPVVESFALAAELRLGSAGTTARLQLALPEQVTATAAEVVPALLSMGRRVLEDRGLSGRALPEVEVTGIERVVGIPPRPEVSGFTATVTNDFTTRRSAVVLASDLLLGNDHGYLLAAAALFAGAEYLMEFGDRAPSQVASRRRSPTRRRTRRGARR